MKKATLMAAGLSSLLLVGCGGGTKEVAECTFPDAPETPAPTWICTEFMEGVSVASVGYARKSAAGSGFMTDQAAADARGKLASAMQTQVNKMVKQYTETTGVGDAETVDQVLTSVNKQLTSQTLSGSKIVNKRPSPTGGLYVLVGIDDNLAKQAVKNMVNTSMKNDQALWQKFQAGKAQDEMAADIANMMGK